MASGKPDASGQERQDFDNPWKEALHEFFPSFLEFFFPDIHADIDWGLGHEFLDAELRQLGRKSRGGRRLPDALVRVVRRNGQEGYVLVHIEIQSQVDQLFTLRVATYNHRIFDVHQLPLVSLVILADPDPRWYPDRYERELWGTRSLLEFRAFKLLDLRDRRLELAASSNPFALLSAAHLAALESGPATRTRLAWKLDLVRSLYRRGVDQERARSLFGLIDWILHLTPTLDSEFCHEVEEIERSTEMRHMTTFERRGLEKGRLEGHLEGQRRMLQGFASARFGEAASAIAEALEVIDDPEVLLRLAGPVATATSVTEVLAAIRKETQGG
ncbi:MAG: hypothetical protein ACOX9B_03030 [Candidatus Xenobium sp.]|jgi:hypothetical protein|nr:hypothetical protein [Burkholderiales bacterium]